MHRNTSEQIHQGEEDIFLGTVLISSFSSLFFLLEKMIIENVLFSSLSCPPVFGRKGGKRRGNPYVFKLFVIESTKTFLPKLTFSKVIFVLPIKPL